MEDLQSVNILTKATGDLRQEEETAEGMCACGGVIESQEVHRRAPDKVLKEGGGCDSCKEVKLFEEGECAAGSHVGRPTGLGWARQLLCYSGRGTLSRRWRAQVAPGRGKEERGGRASPSSSAPESGAFTPSFLAFVITCNTSGSLIYIWKGTIIAKSPYGPLTFGERLQQRM